jgi:hypothetical protein
MSRRFLAAVLVTVCWSGMALGQSGMLFPLEPPAEIARDAFATRYSGLLMDEFAKTVRESADAACLQSNGLDAAKLKQRGTDLFRRWGTRIMERLAGNIDFQKFDSALAARAGANAKQDIATLRRLPEVQRYVTLERPMRLAKVTDFVVEQFDRYVLLTRIRLKSFAPIATGNERLLRANPTEASETAVERLAARKLPQVERFLRLSEAAAGAMQDAFDRETVLLWGPATFYRGVETDLAEICIMPRQ